MERFQCFPMPCKHTWLGEDRVSNRSMGRSKTIPAVPIFTMWAAFKSVDQNKSMEDLGDMEMVFPKKKWRQKWGAHSYRSFSWHCSPKSSSLGLENVGGQIFGRFPYWNMTWEPCRKKYHITSCSVLRARPSAQHPPLNASSIKSQCFLVKFSFSWSLCPKFA